MSTKPPSHIVAEWAGDQRFDTGRPDGPIARLDGSGASGQSPPDALLSALAACSGIDVVDILTKRRTPPSAVTVDVVGERRDDPPRYFTKVRVEYRVKGEGIERVHAERAVKLAFDKYCSVSASLSPDLEVESVLVLNGEAGEPQRQQVRAPVA